ncbi:hypothetical protein SCYAM73S_06582 [Streptomyces cyaneofuscatus]
MLDDVVVRSRVQERLGPAGAAHGHRFALVPGGDGALAAVDDAAVGLPQQVLADLARARQERGPARLQARRRQRGQQPGRGERIAAARLDEHAVAVEERLGPGDVRHRVVARHHGGEDPAARHPAGVEAVPEAGGGQFGGGGRRERAQFGGQVGDGLVDSGGGEAGGVADAPRVLLRALAVQRRGGEELGRSGEHLEGGRSAVRVRADLVERGDRQEPWRGSDVGEVAAEHARQPGAVGAGDAATADARVEDDGGGRCGAHQ